jgi:hypothetical protein
MDLEYPLGTGFGPASTRDELIVSAQSLYQRLLKLAPGSRILPHSVLMVLTENEDGTEDKEKRRSLKNLFRPDADDEVPILAFLQSCDTAYKKLRYFRASVGNSSVIDNVLENIIDTVYGFGLTLLILALLNLNPWPLLVSMSTLLVTFAFAIGPTAAKAIEVRPSPGISSNLPQQLLTACLVSLHVGNSADCREEVRLHSIVVIHSVASNTHEGLLPLLRPFDIGKFAFDFSSLL